MLQGRMVVSMNKYVANFVITDRCNSGCRHCGVDAKPHGEKMELSNALRWMSNFQRTVVNLAGGEPFLEYDMLHKLIEKAHNQYNYTRVITNGFWAKNLEVTRTKLDELVAAGLDEICFSTDNYHQESIPFDYVKNGVIVARELNLLTHVCCCYSRTSSENDHIKRELGDCLYWNLRIMRVGRARNLPKYDPIDLNAIACSDGYCRAPGSCLSIAPDGMIHACTNYPSMSTNHASPIVCGHADDLADIMSQDYNLLIRILKQPYGFKRLLTAIDATGLVHRLKPSYPRVGYECELCIDIFNDIELIQALMTPKSLEYFAMSESLQGAVP